MTKRTLFLIFLLVAAVAVLSFLAISQSAQKPKEELFTSIPSPTPDPSLVPDTTITSSPQAALVRVGTTQTIDVVIDTGNNKLTTIQLEMSFDPQFVEVTEVEPGTFFENPTVLLSEVDSGTGRITLALGSLTPKKGRGELATVTLVAKKPTGPTGKATDLTFLPKTTALGHSNANIASLIRQTIGSQLVITSQ